MYAYKAVTITDPDTLEQFTYDAGDDIPDEHVEMIDESRRDKIFEREEEEMFDENGEMIVLSPNGNLAFDEDGSEEGRAADVSFEDMKVPELKRYASTNAIDLGGATKKDDIVARIQAVEEERASESEGEEEDEDGDEE